MSNIVQSFNNLHLKRIGHDTCDVPGYEYSSILMQSMDNPLIFMLIDSEKALNKFNVKMFDSYESIQSYLIENDINISL